MKPTKYRHCVLLPESHYSPALTIGAICFQVSDGLIFCSKNKFVREFKETETISKFILGLIFKFACTKAEISSAGREWTCLFKNLFT
jgi:hypothetical protein